MDAHARWRTLVSLVAAAVLGGCASTVEATDAGADASGAGACTQWVNTDREEYFGGELYTDLHLSFDAAGQLERRRENIRTGGHGIDRTYQEFTYRWSRTGLTIERVDRPSERVVYTLDGANVVERATESSLDAQRRVVRYTRDAAGRVVERVEELGATATATRCRFDYDASGHALSIDCSDGDVTRYQWEGDRPVRRDHTWRGMHPGFDTWQWNPRGALVRELHDDGYGPGRAYQYDHAYDAEGRLVRTDSTIGTPPVRRQVAGFAYDAQGRLVQESRGFDDAGVARDVATWERDGEGRITRRVSGTSVVRYDYAVTPGQVDVTTTIGDSRATRRYRCFATPVRLAPVEPVLGVQIASVNPEVEGYPIAHEDL